MKHLILRWRYGTLTGLVVALMMICPVFEADMVSSAIAMALFVAVGMFGLASIGHDRSAMRGAAVMGALATVSSLPGLARLDLGRWSAVADVVGHTALALFIGMVITAILRRILSGSRVDVDTVFGGICVYFLLAILWAAFYDMLLAAFPGSFVHDGKVVVSGLDTFDLLLYFSFTTLATVGYGDIVPANGLARSLANLEAMIGQLYVAVFIARLVALHVASDQPPPTDKRP